MQQTWDITYHCAKNGYFSKSPIRKLMARLDSSPNKIIFSLNILTTVLTQTNVSLGKRVQIVPI